ncbi:hypothetical protein BU15DRAFT_64366 [Melanogaster broomeanus]|nr:hypothetical protein BU15DRAFT_64366 [Melanogaster broomeanus]
MLYHFLRKLLVKSLPRLPPTPLPTIRPKQIEFRLVREYNSLPVFFSPVFKHLEYLQGIENTEIQNVQSMKTQNITNTENNDMGVDEESHTTKKPAKKARITLHHPNSYKITEKVNKGKGKKTPTVTEENEDNMNVDSKKEDSALKKTKKTKGDMTTKSKKKAIRGKVASTLQHIKKGDIQSMIEKIHKELHEATISYTLMTIHDKIDLNNGLSIITHIINSRSLNIKYVNEFTRWVKSTQ